MKKRVTVFVECPKCHTKYKGIANVDFAKRDFLSIKFRCLKCKHKIKYDTPELDKTDLL